MACLKRDPDTTLLGEVEMLVLLMFTVFAVRGLIIAAAGIFALTAFGVTLRQREMGVRLTLGATPPDLVRLVIREALVPVAVGVAVGVAGAVWAVDLLQELRSIAPMRAIPERSRSWLSCCS